MAKSVLKLEDDDYDFILIGIASSFRDFRVCREVNSSLGIELHRTEDYSIHDRKKETEVLFPYFGYTTEQEDQYYVIGNKSEGGLLIPEQKQLDFFLVIKPGMSPIDRTEIVRALHRNSVFQGVFPLNVNSLKSKDNLLF